MTRFGLVLLLASVLQGLQGCALLYDEIQDIAKSQCDRIYDMAERSRCQRANSAPQERYEAERDRIRKGG